MAKTLTSFPGPKTDTAKTSGAVTVTTSSTLIAAANSARAEITIRNIDATNFLDLAFNTTDGTSTPTAVAASGLRLKAGDSWTSQAYIGPISGIANTASVVVTVAEF